MSEPKLISPMLDGFEMGGPISDHNGVRCCPAMRKNSDDKYIVKIISVPASQTKLDALLLTGAYPSKEAALEYFKELADGIAEEKRVLDDLAKLEGFIPYEDCQIVPMEDATGYDVYLLNKYHMTLDRILAKGPLTQLAAVNLGLDLCTALSICRRSGYLCVDLKPTNIVLTGDKEYCIGDLGFTSLNSLQYASLPDKYRSSYTAPEVEDAFSALSENMDIYAVGLILYQIYNAGVLPFSGDNAANEIFAAPKLADEEIAEIILKACHPDPAERWQDPVEMGQALVSYMQKNGVNDTPLTSEFFGEPEPITEEAETEEESEEIEAEVLPAETEELPSAEKEIIPEPEIVEDSSTETELITDAEEPIPAEALIPEEQPIEESVDKPAEDSTPVSNIEAVVEDVQPTEITEDIEPDKKETEDFDNLSFLDENGEEVQVDYDVTSDDVSKMLEQIDELAAHQIPEPPVAPEPVEIKLPEPEPEETTVTEEQEPAEEEPEAPQQEAASSEPEPEPVEDAPEEMPYVPKKKRTGLTLCIILLILIALGVGGFFFYRDYYLQPIHTLTLNGAEDRLQVQLTADIDESYLTVICADPHGNRIPAPVVGGTAVFTGLAPDTAYTVSVEVDGIHKLTGVTTKVYSTPVQTKIVQTSIVTGAESGSVILSFAVDGPDSDQWNVIYNADGEAERVTAFPSHMVTLTGLTVGKEYTFRLEPVDDIYLSEAAEFTYVARDLVCAENLRVTACADGILTAQWDTPEGLEVGQWSVRCYNENGYDETITTNENTVTFEGIDDTSGYTVDVTAEGMSVNQRVLVSPNSVTVSDFTVDTSRADVLKLSWSANKDIPSGGWTIRYSVDGVNATENLTTTSNSVQVPAVPGGSYVFTITDSSGNAVLGGPFVHTQAEAASFSGFNTSASNMTVRLCKTPSSASWSYKDLEDDDYVNSFSVGQKISAVVALSGSTSKADDSVLVTFAVYNEDGELAAFSHTSQTWRSMWYENYCELDISGTPTAVGTYNLVLLFNGQTVGSQKFAITN